jgi:hypothetical protein
MFDAVIYAAGSSLDELAAPIPSHISICVNSAIWSPIVSESVDYWMVSDPPAMKYIEEPTRATILHPYQWESERHPHFYKNWEPKHQENFLASPRRDFDVEGVIQALGPGAPGRWRKWTTGKAVAWLATAGCREIAAVGMDWTGNRYYGGLVKKGAESRWESERADIEFLCGFSGVTLRRLRPARLSSQE